MEYSPAIRNPAFVQPLDMIMHELEMTLPWLCQPPFCIGEFSGYQPGSFGAGDGVQRTTVVSVLHEVAHALEFVLTLPAHKWKKRLAEDNFGLTFTATKILLGITVCEPETMQGTARECRTHGIQRRLLEIGGFEVGDLFVEGALSLTYLADADYGGTSPRNVHDVAKYNAQQRHWLVTRTNLMSKQYEEATPQMIVEAWGKVMVFFEKKKHLLRPEGQRPQLNPVENRLS